MDMPLEPSGSRSRKRSHSKLEQRQGLRRSSLHNPRTFSARTATPGPLPSTSCQYFHTGRPYSETMERRSLDLRRPSFSQGEPEVIDLTSEAEPDVNQVTGHRSATPSLFMSMSLSSRSGEVIDLESDDSEATEHSTDTEDPDEILEDSGSSDVEFISSRRIPDPQPNLTAENSHPQRLLPIPPRNLIDSTFEHYPAIPRGFRPSPGPYHRRLLAPPWVSSMPLASERVHTPRSELASSPMDFLRPPSILRGMASVARGHANRLATNLFPTSFDYAVPAFSMGTFMTARGPTRSNPVPPVPTYSPPPPAREGFTRSPQEDDVLICPNCLDELCIGEGSQKSKVYVVRACGHVYCGECARYRHKTKHNGKQPANTKSQPFSVCKVPGCGKAVKAPAAMVELYL